MRFASRVSACAVLTLSLSFMIMLTGCEQMPQRTAFSSVPSQAEASGGSDAMFADDRVLTSSDLLEKNIGEIYTVYGVLTRAERAKSGNILLTIESEDGEFAVYIRESTGIDGFLFTPGESYRFEGCLQTYQGSYELVPQDVSGVVHDGGFHFETVYIEKVIDGDTVRAVMPDGSTEKIRLIGVDAPETEKPGQPGEPLADEATDFTSDLLLGKSVYIENDNNARDTYGRLLCYIWLSLPQTIDRETVLEGNVSAQLLSAGLAEAIRVGDNDKYYDLFLDIADTSNGFEGD